VSLISSTYFQQIDILIPSEQVDLSTLIARYEPEILKKLLGYELYDILNTYGSTGTGTARLDDLRDGKEYTLNGETVKWPGLINSEKRSLIAYYCYYKWLEITITGVGSAGLFIADMENSTKASHINNMMYAWSEMLRLYGYPKVYFDDLTDDPYKESAYNFLLANKSDYPEWTFEVLEPKNRFGI